MPRTLKTLAPYAWMAAVLSFFFFPLILPQMAPDSPELFGTERLREAIRDAFAVGQWPLFNPLLGPGGSAAQIYSIIPWDYHLWLHGILGDWDYQVLIDGVLMGLAFLFSTRMMGIHPKASWFFLPLGFLFLYTVDFVHFQAIPLYYDALFIAFLPLCAVIHRIESRGATTKDFLWVTLLYTLSFHGSKIEVWGIQLPAVLSLWVIGLRHAYRRKGPVLGYVGALAFGWAANLWQIYWLKGLIGESGRAGAAGTTSVIEFFQSFTSSPLILALLGYYALTFALLGRRRWLSVAILVIVGALFPERWLAEDILVPHYLRDYRGMVFLGLLGLEYVRLIRFRGERQLYFEFPVLLICSAHFLFENEHTWNWGARTVEYYNPTLFFLFFTGVLFSLHSPRRELRTGLLTILVGLYLFRAHLSILSLRAVGFLWHNQRDTYFPSAAFALLALLGWEYVVGYWRARRRWVNVGMMVSLGLVGAANLVFLQRMNFRRVDSGWAIAEKPSCSTRFLQVLREKNLVGPEWKFAGSPWAIMPASLLPLGVHHVNVYDSLVTRETKQYLSSESRQGPVREECRLPYPWLPNNLQRVVNCSREERGWHYNNIISPMFDFRSVMELRRAGVNLVLSDVELGKGFSRVTELRECVGTPEYREKAILFASTTKPSFALFYPGDCRNFDLKQARPLESDTDLFRTPYLKDRFRLSFIAPSSGCVQIRLAFSRFWQFSVLGAEPGEGVFTRFPTPQGNHVIEGRYAPVLPYLVGLGVLLQLTLLAAMVVFGLPKMKIVSKPSQSRIPGVVKSATP